MKKRILALLLVFAMMLSVLSVLTACNDGDEGGSENGGDNTGSGGDNTGGEGGNTGNEGGNTGSGGGDNTGNEGGNTGSGDNTPKNETYTITLKDIGGKPFNGVVYMIEELVDSTYVTVTAGTFDAEGKASFSAVASDNYVIRLIGIPQGYSVGDYYPVIANTQIVLTPSVIPDKNLNGVNYKVGDVMRDFTLTDIDGNVLTLSEILKEKKMVMLNFWYSGCNPCRMEFPHMESAYSTPHSEDSDAAYKDTVEIIAICPSSQRDTLADVIAFREEFGLTFPVVFYDDIAFLNAFSVTGYPTSVFIDRYGTICAIQTGAVTDQRAFPAAFAHFSSDNYQQQLLNFIEELIPTEYPDVEMPESSEIESILNGKNEATDDENDKIGATYAPETEPGVAELVWPFLIGNKDGYDCIYASNSGKVQSYAMIYSYVELRAGEALAIDYYASTERGCDYLYVIVDGKDILAISGDSSDEGWTTCYPYVADKDGTYEVVFAYIKDESTDFGEDTVYLKDYRIVSEDQIDKRTYIPKYAASDLSDNGVTYENYVTIVYNAKDGYYHVGDENGPLLLVNLLGETNFDRDSIQNLVTNNKIMLNGADIYDIVIKYCNYASNSTMPGYCPVTRELYDCLIRVAEELGIGNMFYGSTAEQDMLTMCEYYDAYGPGKVQLEDPIKGLANFSAYDVIENAADDKDSFPNKFHYDRLIMPRGLRAKFVPSVSGVYLIVSKSDYETDAWIFLEDGSQYLDYQNTDRHASDYNNCYIIAYLEAGKSYYIDIAFYEPTQEGDVYFNVRWVGEDGYEDANGNYYRFGRASDTAYTYDPSDFRCPTCGTGLENIVSSNPETGTGKGTCPTCKVEATGSLSYELIDGGIKVAYDPETDRYYEVLADGSLGGMLYADFWMDMGVFGTGQNLMFVLEKGGFDFTRNEDGGTISGVDYTARVREIISELLMDEGVLGELDYATDGCVPVTRELAGILQSLMDKYTFRIETPGEDYERGSWKKLCYRFEYFGEKNIPASRNFEE